MTMTTQVAAARPAWFTSDRTFFGALWLVTTLPFVAIPLLVVAGAEHATWVTAYAVVLSLIGNGHVGATGFFYFDSGYAGIRRSDPQRFALAPVLIPLTVAAIWTAAPALHGALLSAYLVWNFYHYQRQNYGLTALAAASTTFGRLPARLSAALNLASFAGIAGYLSTPAGWDLAADGLLNRFGGWMPHTLYIVAVCLYIAATIQLMAALWICPALGRNPRVMGLALASWAFFLPAILSRNNSVALVTYATAHALQYFLMLAISARGSRATLRATVGLAASALGFFAVSRWIQVSPLIMGAYLGGGIFHFLADAKVWRLREPEQRKLMQDRFWFLFPARLHR